MAFGGFVLREADGLWERFFYFLSFCFSTLKCFFIGRPQRGIYWRKFGFSLSGVAFSLIWNNWIKTKFNNKMRTYDDQN